MIFDSLSCYTELHLPVCFYYLMSHLQVYTPPSSLVRLVMESMAGASVTRNIARSPKAAGSLHRPLLPGSPVRES